MRTFPILSTQGMAPFAVHVHGLDTSLGAGDPLTALYEWDFDDPSGDYDTLVGWSAAHVYDEPGTYTLTLKVTNHNGLSDVASVQVHVAADHPPDALRGGETATTTTAGCRRASR